MTLTPLKKTSCGRARYNSIKNDTKIGLDTKHLHQYIYIHTFINITILNIGIQIFPVLVLASDIATMCPYFYKPVGKTR